MKQKSGVKVGAIICGVIALIVVIFGVFYASNANKFNGLKQQYESQYGQVQAAMQRRNDLIPNMTAAVKGDMKQEKSIFDDLAKARSAYSDAKSPNAKMKASDEIHKQTNLLVNVINERYPKLASSSRVHELMIELEGSENRINQERRLYNQDLQAYNTAIGHFPGSIIAGMSGYHYVPYYHADSEAQHAPKVDLN